MRKSIARLLLLALPASIVAVISGATPAFAVENRTCTNVYRIQAANGYYVTAETGRATFDGMLRARTPSNALGTWEEYAVFQIITESQLVFYSFQAHNGRFVDTWNSYTGSNKGMLRASATTDRYNDQRFRLPYDVIQEGQLVNIRSALNGMYVAAEEGYTGDRFGMLRARTPAGSTGNWELFRLQYVRDC